MEYIKHIKSHRHYCFSVKRFPPKVYRMSTFVCDDDDDNAVDDTNIDDGEVYIRIAFAQLC